MITTRVKDWTIAEIHALSESEAKDMAEEHLTVKEHDVYFVDFGGYFGYGTLVYFDGHHIYYVDDFELHHPNKTREQLREWFIKCLNDKLFTEAELAEPLSSYEEYSRKDYFLRNYYGMRKDHISFFFCGSDEERQKRLDYVKSENMIESFVAFAYYNRSDEAFVKHHIELSETLNKLREEAEKGYEYLKKAFLQEMWNHEYIYNWQGNWDVLSCFGNIRYVDTDDYEEYFDQLNFDDIHRKAYKVALKEYLKKAEEMDL